MPEHHANRSAPGTTRKRLAALDRLIYYFSFRAVPLGIVVISILTLFTLHTQNDFTRGTALPIRVLDSSPGIQGPAVALARLQGHDTAESYSRPVSDSPFWFSFAVPLPALRGDASIEAPLSYAQSLACWDGANLEPLGSAGRGQPTGSLQRAKAGFMIRLATISLPTTIICRTTSFEDVRLSAALWSTAELEKSIENFDRSAGILEGGLLTLTLIVLIFAIINREWMYVLFAAWLLGNLHISAVSMGWDTRWLGYTGSDEWMPLLRKLTIAVYYLLTYALFAQLFLADLRRIDFPRLQKAILWAGMALLLAACVLPYAQFLPVMWALTAFGIAIATFLSGRVLAATRSRVALWYSLSLGIALGAGVLHSLARISPVAFFSNSLINVVAALLSSTIVALAIAEHLCAERRKRMQAQAELQSIYEVTPTGLFTLEGSGVISRTNPALEKMLAFIPTSGKHRHWADYFGPDCWQSLNTAVNEDLSAEMEMQTIASDRVRERYFLVTAVRAHNKIEGSLQDITAQAHTIAQLRIMAHHDPLTNALNQRGIEDKFDESLNALASGKSAALAYVTISPLKVINDTYGHTAGDEFLKQISHRIRDNLAGFQHLGRLGGDEFVILFQNCPRARSIDICQRVIDDFLAAPCQIGSRAFQARAAIGMVDITTRLGIQDTILTAARTSRTARKLNQHQVLVYEHNVETQHEHIQDLHVIKELSGTFSSRYLFLVMQPIMSLNAPLETLNFEVLLRMYDASGNVIPAAKLIMAAEESGTVSAVDKWVVGTALKWLSDHRHQLRNTQLVCINLSGMSLNDERFVEEFFDILGQYRHLTDILCIEITESVALQNMENARRFIRRLQTLGVRTALDDFGAGYTSFTYLTELPADALKIDGSFIKSMSEHPANLAIVEAIIALARRLGMKSIAEWVEDIATLEALRKMGIDYVQGFAIAKPLCPEDILAAIDVSSIISDDNVRAFVRSIPASKAQPT